MIYYARYFYSNSMKMLSLQYHVLIGKTEEREGKKCLVVND